MDVYHKVLAKLYEVTGGRDTQMVDFKDLIKEQGFLGNYDDIFQMLSSQGWIAEAPKVNFVKITHWGVKEARKSSDGISDQNELEIERTANRLLSDTKEFLVMVEEFTDDFSKENFVLVEKKFEALNTSISKLKERV